MSTLSYFAINSTNKTFSILEYSNPNKIIGKLYPKEFFIGNYEDPCYLAFLSSDGTIKAGLIYDDDYKFTQIRYLPYSKEIVNGSERLIYQMRKTMNVYTPSGDYWGKVAAGMFVATDTCTPGEINEYLMKITDVKSTKGEWVPVKGDGYSHGFVDTGFRTASSHNLIALHGNW